LQQLKNLPCDKGADVIGIKNYKALVLLPIICFIFACDLRPGASVPSLSIEEMIASTEAAARQETLTHLPSATPTSTSTITPTPFFPSATPTATFPFGIFVEEPLISVVETADESFVLTGPTSDPQYGSIKYTDESWACMVVGRSPSKDSTVKPGSNFYVSWTIINVGMKAWTYNGVDFVYDSGLRHDGGPIQDLSRTVPRGGKITLKVLIITPRKADTYNVIWSLKVGNTMFCHMKVSFVVK
jgi:hypothetical protein